MNLIEVLVAILLFAGFPTGVYVFARKKVTWSGRKQVMSGTIAVIILSIIISVFL